MHVSRRERIRNRLYGTKVYSLARNIYQALFDREVLRYRSRMLKFYGQFFRRGDLVFDVGANIGEYAEMFSSLGRNCCGGRAESGVLPISVSARTHEERSRGELRGGAAPGKCQPEDLRSKPV